MNQNHHPRQSLQRRIVIWLRGHLWSVSIWKTFLDEALEKYQDIIRRYVRRKQGVYALYRRGKLHYVGLASNLRSSRSSPEGSAPGLMGSVQCLPNDRRQAPERT